MKPYSEDLRKAAIAAYRTGKKSQQEIASLFGVHYNSLKNWLRMDEDGKEQKAQGKGHRPRLLTNEHLQIIKNAILKNNSLTVKDLIRIVGVDCSAGVYQRALKQLGFSYKKNSYQPRNKESQT